MKTLYSTFLLVLFHFVHANGQKIINTIAIDANMLLETSRSSIAVHDQISSISHSPSVVNEAPLDFFKHISYDTVPSMHREFKANAVKADLLSKTFLSAIADPGGAPNLPLRTLSIEDVTWVNNITDLTGRIVRVIKEADGKETYDLQIQASYDTVKKKITTPSHPLIDTKHFSKERRGDLNILGISGQLQDKSIYEYSSITTAFTRITDKQIDKRKIPASAKCSDMSKCEYYYINAATIQTISVLILTEVSRKARVSDLPNPAAVLNLDGGFYSGNRNEQKNARNILFCTLVRIP